METKTRVYKYISLFITFRKEKIEDKHQILPQGSDKFNTHTEIGTKKERLINVRSNCRIAGDAIGCLNVRILNAIGIVEAHVHDNI